MAGLNWVDGVLLVLVALVAWGATTRGFVQVFTGLVGFVLTLLAALLLTAPLAEWLGRNLAVGQLWAAPIAFLLIWLAAQIVFTAPDEPRQRKCSELHHNGNGGTHPDCRRVTRTVEREHE